MIVSTIDCVASFLANLSRYLSINVSNFVIFGSPDELFGGDAILGLGLGLGDLRFGEVGFVRAFGESFFATERPFSLSERSSSSFS